MIFRKMKIRVGDSFSEEIDITFSVPQGSCAGPVAYNLYASTLKDYIYSNITPGHGMISIVGYADDHSYYNSFTTDNPLDEIRCINLLEDCAKVIKNWMNVNRLRLNSAKTEYIIFASKGQRKKCSFNGIKINDAHIEEKICIKYLGVLLDNELSFRQQINEKCKTAMYTLFRIRQLRCHLDRKSVEQLVHSLVISQLDYCCTILYGLPKTVTCNLQRVQNFAAKIILHKKKFDSASSCLRELHWLPIESMILFRLLCMSFKCVHGLAPKYLLDMFTKLDCNYSLRSGGQYKIPRTNRKTLGDRSFSVAGPREWNNLPLDIRSCRTFPTFQSKLKTHLFHLAFK